MAVAAELDGHMTVGRLELVGAEQVDDRVGFADREPHRARLLGERVDREDRGVAPIGAMGQNGSYTKNSGSGTFVSPHGYHVVSTGPVVIYQFNPIIQQFSNDASTLIPTTTTSSPSPKSSA